MKYKLLNGDKSLKILFGTCSKAPLCIKRVMHSEEHNLFKQKCHFITGKGGVGKSTVACVLALKFAAQGHKTLLCQVNAHDSHSALLSVPTVTTKIEQSMPNLYTVNITPQSALKEYALMTIKLESLYNLVFENRMVKTFLEFLPSLAELNILGKIWFHCTQEQHSKNVWDKIVVDAPATGHGLSMFGVLRNIRKIAGPIGPLAKSVQNIEDDLYDADKCRVHLVNLLAELPTQETLETLEYFAKQKERPYFQIGHLINNRVTPHLFNIPQSSLHKICNKKSLQELKNSIGDLEKLHTWYKNSEEVEEQARQKIAVALKHFSHSQILEIPEILDFQGSKLQYLSAFLSAERSCDAR